VLSDVCYRRNAEILPIELGEVGVYFSGKNAFVTECLQSKVKSTQTRK